MMAYMRSMLGFTGKCIACFVIGHRNVVKVIGMGFDPSISGKHVAKDSAFICMEACLHGSLRDLIRRQMFLYNKVSMILLSAWHCSVCFGKPACLGLIV